MIDEPSSSNKKKKIILIAIPIILILGYIGWIRFLDFGKIEVYENPPYEVVVFDQGTYQCEDAPCVIKTETGPKFISFYKTGYKSIKENIEVNLWTSTEVYPELKRDPHLGTIEKIPESPTKYPHKKYDIQYNEKNHNWKLVEEDTPDRAIIYFPKKPKDYQLLSGNNAAVLLTNTVTYIKTQSKQTQNIADANYSAIALKVSPNGKYFLIKTRDQQNQLSTKVISQNLVTTLNENAKFESAYWTPKNVLILISKLETQWLFEEYNPETNQTQELLTTNMLLYKPSNIVAGKNGETLYFKSGEKFFQLNF
ncbi:hypothetical protein HOE67_02820 [Candidatus Peregrinibacteria bacterium]|jgi:hypothetical protein|nr:hypothetical protein [Candidatus Peregrinibacteria bacterium]MBT4056019.1 hypothetical protein [Candidatus Peregrinibacteria bacterium]